ncbi:MAG: hypothetical protein ACTSR2_03120, partial [Candidatus Hodarchaeales archaeon]
MTNELQSEIDPSGKTMVKFVDTICKEVGSRLAGTHAEKKAGDIIYDEFNSYCDEVTQEEFTCHPQGFLDFIRVVAFLYGLAILTYYYVNPIIARILIISALAIYVMRQNLLWEVVD